MNDAFIIRPMEEKDIDAVSCLERECFSTPWSPKGFYDALALDTSIFMTACHPDTGEVVGYCGLYTAADEGEITNVAVSAQERGKRIAERLLWKVFAAAADRGVRNIYLEVRMSNDSAIRLYRRIGFEMCGKRKRFYSNPEEDAYVMKLHIGKGKNVVC